jgi:hypothetical protein
VVLEDLLDLVVAKAAEIRVFERRVVGGEGGPGIVRAIERLCQPSSVDRLVELLRGVGHLQPLGRRAVGEQNVPNHVSHAVVGFHVGLRHRGALDEDVAVAVDADLNLVAGDRRKGIAVLQVIGQYSRALHDVIVQHRAEEVGVAGQKVDVVGLKGRVGRGKHREGFARVVERADPVGGLQRCGKGAQVVTASHSVDERRRGFGIVVIIVVVHVSVAVAAGQHEAQR